MTLGPKIWNSLPDNIKELTPPQKFTEFIKKWHGPECKWNISKYSDDMYS